MYKEDILPVLATIGFIIGLLFWLGPGKAMDQDNGDYKGHRAVKCVIK